MTRSCHDLYPLIRPPGRPLALIKGGTHIPGFIWSPPTLAAYDIAHFLPLGGAGRGFLFTEDEARRHFSHLSGTFRELEVSPRKGRNYARVAEAKPCRCKAAGKIMDAGDECD
jgi:hypothetical protein